MFPVGVFKALQVLSTPVCTGDIIVVTDGNENTTPYLSQVEPEVIRSSFPWALAEGATGGTCPLLARGIFFLLTIKTRKMLLF